MSIKCPQCGLVNFGSAPECKRCRYEFVTPAAGHPRTEEQPSTMRPDEQQTQAQDSGQPAQAPKTFTTLPVFEPVATPIDGWLVVFAILMGLSLAVTTYAIHKAISMYSTEEYQALTKIGSLLFIPGFSSWFTFELICNCFLAVSMVILFIRFFQKSKSFPNMMIALLSLSIVVQSIDYLMASACVKELSRKLASIRSNAPVPELIPDYWGQLVLLAIGLCVVWIGYFLTSRRVETTFVY